jgi:S1/P1 nuclease
MRITRIALAAALTLYATQAFAWNGRGHMIVAAIAWDQLTDATKTRVSTLLKLNPYYAKWTKGVSTANRDEYAFIAAATWPDDIKQDQAYTNDQQSAPTAGQNIGYTDTFTHKYWHFVDAPLPEEGNPPAETPDAQTQIVLFRDAIGAANADDVKSYDVTWLEHLVGDVHQPLHATNGFSSVFPKGDGGGNAVNVTVPKGVEGCKAKKGCKKALHAFWDDVLGSASNSIPYGTRAAAAVTAAKDIPAATSGSDDVNVDDWLSESYSAANDNAYALPVKDGKGPYKLTKSYTDDALKVAQARVALAGARLANLLNDHLQ